MNDFEKIEHLLLSKKFEELSPSELKEVQGHFENATDYNDMRDTLMQVKSTLAADKLLIKPSVDLKEKLLKQFENTYSNNNNKIAGKTRPFYKTLAFQWSAAASVVIILSISAIGYFNKVTNNSKEMAVNYKKEDGKNTLVPEEEKTSSPVNDGVVTDSTTSTTGVSATQGDGDGDKKTGYTNAPVGSNQQEDVMKNKSTIYGNMSRKETEVNEGFSYESNTNTEAVQDEERQDDNKPMLKDNTTIIDVSKEENRDANYHYNDVKDSKLLENTTIQTKTANDINTNPNTTKQYWAKKKQDKLNNQGEVKQEKTEDVNLGGYMSVNQMVQTDKQDSLKLQMDSLKMDSNYQNLLRSRDAKIDTNAPQKDN